VNKDRIYKLLPTINSAPMQTQSRSGWVIAKCPFSRWDHESGVDTNPSFAITIKDSEESRYNCFACGNHGDLEELVQKLQYNLKDGSNDGAYNLQVALQLIATEDEFDLMIKDYEEPEDKSEPIHYFPEYWLDSFILASKSSDAIEYLQSRNVSPKVTKSLDLRYDSFRKMVCFPIRDSQGDLVGLHGRDITDTGPLKYNVYLHEQHKNTTVWLGESWIDPDKPVVLVESVFDLASVYRVYTNVMCGLSAGLSYARVKRVSDIVELITLYDHGKGGDSARMKLSQYLPHSNLTHLIPTELQGDPGNCNCSELSELLSPYIHLTT